MTSERGEIVQGAVVNLTRALALDLGKKGVRINAVCPSLTRTGMTRGHRILANDDASFITGVNLPVDGGVSTSNGQPPQQ